MTEQEWFSEDNVRAMVQFLQGKLSERKWRLFACACCRTLNRWGNHTGLAVVESAERVADGRLSLEEAISRSDSIRRLYWDAWTVSPTPWETAARFASLDIWQGPALLRCIAGNPFHAATIEPAWLTWESGIVAKLAQGIYDERAFDRLPILADALEEAGCTDRTLLDHCRGGGPHALGCWVLDVVLGLA